METPGKIEKSHPSRTLEPSNIIIRSLYPINYWDCCGYGLGQGSFYMHEMTIPISIGLIKRCNQ